MVVDSGIFVGPKPAPELVQAVRAAGGRLTSAADAEAVIWFGGQPSEFAAFVTPAVRWVQLPGAGVDKWFDAGVITADRVFTSATGCNAPAVAEHALALLLAAARRLPELARARTWTPRPPDTLRQAIVAIVGAGGIGKELIRLLEPLGSRVLAVTRSGRPVAGADRSYGPDGLLEVLRAADYVVLAAPSTSRTRSMIGAPELVAMKPSAWLVNISRGALVDTDALVSALREGQIRGAALDVTDPEPLPDDHPLWTEPRALITPHRGNTKELRMSGLAERVRENTERFLAGRPLVGMVDLAAGY